jgi:hypothetical protein
LPAPGGALAHLPVGDQQLPGAAVASETAARIYEVNATDQPGSHRVKAERVGPGLVDFGPAVLLGLADRVTLADYSHRDPRIYTQNDKFA